MASVVELDLRGLKCPMPVLRTRRALRRLAPGDTLVVTCNDPLAVLDIPNLVREEAQSLGVTHVADGVSTFHILKRS